MKLKAHKEFWGNLLILILLSGCATTESMLKPSSGEKILPVVATGIGLTKENALKKAFRDAVEKTVGIYIDSTTLVEKAQLIEDKILKYSGGYVKKYTILAENSLDDGTYLTRIQALVMANNVELDLTKNEIFKVESKNLLAQATTMRERNLQAYEIAKDLFEDYPNNAHTVLTTKFDIAEVGIEKEATVEIGFKILRSNLWYNRFRNLLIAMNDKTQGRVVDLTDDIPIAYCHHSLPCDHGYSCDRGQHIGHERYFVNFAIHEYMVKSTCWGSRDGNLYDLKVLFYDSKGREINSFVGGLSSRSLAWEQGVRPFDGLGFVPGGKIWLTEERQKHGNVLSVLKQSKWDYLGREFFYRVLLPFDVIDNTKDIKAEVIAVQREGYYSDKTKAKPIEKNKN
ncbi:hypothetical protein KJ693_11670 [bacterium]|nr:hypothetical protein [bacterium]MBU1615949.1 hypothetical protein [bacterium]